ncbi:MAG: family 78 glycoside hydrolase catalytic domain, partial [Massilioclostridium sp.]|nr:family 78 glycoside hydrolase catalytic domain [Massilioclostridium sp.]
MKKKKVLALLLSATISLSAVFSSGIATAADLGTTDVTSLTTNYLTDPIGLSSDNIRFSWQMESNRIGQVQAGYQIRVYKSAPNGELVWDSGLVADDKSVAIPYGGPQLELETRYYWTVEVTDLYGETESSTPAYFETGCSWEGAEWIYSPAQDSGAPLFRTEKALSGNVSSAKLYISSLGIYDAYINGREVKRIQSDGTEVDDTFNPGWTDYNSYVNYQSYDVTEYVTGDAVALGVMVGKGWYGGSIGITAKYKELIGDPEIAELALFAKLLITYEDGSQEVIVTNTSDWKASDNSPVTANDYFNGSSYDANIAEKMSGWNNTGYDDSDWNAVETLDYTGDARPNSSASARIADELDVRPIGGEDCFVYTDTETELPADQGGTSDYAYGNVVKHPVDVNGEISLKAGETLILDLGQNMVGVAHLKATGNQGTTITMRHAEMLNDGRKNDKVETGGSDGPKGTIYTKSLKGALVTDTYTFGSSGRCDWTPPFTFHGFRYLEITASGDVTIELVSGAVITSTNEQTGFLETSNADVNQLVSNTLWSQRGNYLSIPTDCPQRAERTGWTGDAQLFSQTALYNFDVVPFLENYTEIMNMHNQNNGGAYHSIMPTGYLSFLANLIASGWSDAGIIIPWTLYHQTGDTSLIREYYDEMDAYMDLVGEQGYNTGKFGDWLSFQGTSNQFLNACYRAYTAQLMAEMGGVIGNQLAVDKYNTLFEETKQAFLDKYVEEDGTVLTASADNFTITAHGYPTADNAQTGLLWTLKLGFYENEAQKEAMIDNLLTNIRNEGLAIRPDYAENTLAVGFLGVNVILPVLSEIGEGDMAYTLLLQDEMPSWLYSVKNGATTIWERWNSYSNQDSFGDSGMNSFNHYSYGAVLEWMYEYMAGIRSSEENPGFKEIVLQPSVPSDNSIDFAKGRYDSTYGTIVSNWTADNGALTSYKAVVPANTTATLYLPVSQDVAMTFQNIDGVTFQGMEEHNGQMTAKFSVLAG